MLNFKRKKTINQNHKKQTVPGTMWVITNFDQFCTLQMTTLQPKKY